MVKNQEDRLKNLFYYRSIILDFLCVVADKHHRMYLIIKIAGNYDSVTTCYSIFKKIKDNYFLSLKHL